MPGANLLRSSRNSGLWPEILNAEILFVQRCDSGESGRTEAVVQFNFRPRTAARPGLPAHSKADGNFPASVGFAGISRLQTFERCYRDGGTRLILEVSVTKAIGERVQVRGNMGL